jgi:predicted DNA-binding transcriptional regulator AlpA
LFGDAAFVVIVADAAARERGPAIRCQGGAGEDVVGAAVSWFGITPWVAETVVAVSSGMGQSPIYRFAQKSGFPDSEKLCGFASLREKSLNRDEWIGSIMVLGVLELWKRELSKVPGRKE